MRRGAIFTKRFLTDGPAAIILLKGQAAFAAEGNDSDMYCKNCGAELNDLYVVCVMCRKGKGFGNKYCAYCGEALPHPGADRCAACGKPTGPEDPKNPITPDKKRFSPVAAFLISAIIPGMAQACNGQFLKGIGIFLVYAVLNLWHSDVLLGIVSMHAIYLNLVVQGIYALIAAADAALGARKLQEGKAMGKYEFF